MEKEKGLYSKNTIGILLFKIVLPRYKLDYFYERITQECKMFCIFLIMHGERKRVIQQEYNRCTIV